VVGPLPEGLLDTVAPFPTNFSIPYFGTSPTTYLNQKNSCRTVAV